MVRGFHLINVICVGRWILDGVSSIRSACNCRHSSNCTACSAIKRATRFRPCHPATSVSQTAGGKLVHQKSTISPLAASTTLPPPPISITGEIKQGGDGGCQQNIIGGNGNTQNCVVPPFSVSNEQVATIAAYLKAANLKDQRDVAVDYEYSAVGGAEAATNLVAAFNEGGVKAILGDGAVIRISTCNQRFIAPGLSVDCITPADQPFLDALAEAFAKTNLASTQNPIQGRRAPPGSTAPLLFMIRKR